MDKFWRVGKIRWDAKRNKLSQLLLFSSWVGLIYSMLSANKIVVKTLLLVILCLPSSQSEIVNFKELIFFKS